MNISSVGSRSMMPPPPPPQGVGGFQRGQGANSSKMAEELFSKLDSDNQGYIEKSDLEAALSSVSGSSSSSSTSSADELFGALDSDGDGQVTQQEFTSTLEKFASQQGGPQGAGGPPLPPPSENDSGFTKDELQSQLDSIGSSDSQRSSFISNLVENFDKADANGDGKVTFQEAQALNDRNSPSSSSMTGNGQEQLLEQMKKLMSSYLVNGASSSSWAATA